MQQSTVADVDSITQIDAVPKILEAVSELTGLKFVCIARVTKSVLRIAFVFRQLVHARALSKLGGALVATVQHDDQRPAMLRHRIWFAFRQIEPVAHSVAGGGCESSWERKLGCQPPARRRMNIGPRMLADCEWCGLRSRTFGGRFAP